MTEKKLRDLAQAAGFSIKKGFTYSESNGVHTGESGYEIVNERTHEPVTFNAYGEDNIHYGYSLEEVEDFLRNVYEQAGIPFPEGEKNAEEDSKEIPVKKSFRTTHFEKFKQASKELTDLFEKHATGELDEIDKDVFDIDVSSCLYSVLATTENMFVELSKRIEELEQK